MTFKTQYSFRKTTGTPEEVCARLKELGHEYAAISDIDSTFAWVKWRDAAKKHGLKPIYGVSLHVTPLIAAKKPILDLFTFYAVDDIKPLNDLVSKAFAQGRSLSRVGFTPLLKYTDLLNIGNVIKVAGYKARLEFLDNKDDNLFIGLSPACAKGYVNAAIDKGFNFIAMQEQRFVREEDSQFYEIACGFNADVKTYPQWILSYEEWYRSIDHAKLIKGEPDRAELNRKVKFSNCTADLRKGNLLYPKVDKTLEEMCRDGIERLGLDWPANYEDRLQAELKVILEKKFEAYFFLVADLMLWARKNMMVGPGRGSSAGSLVCYLLGITHVDPIQYDLLFFRFLDPSRPDWPDIDSDLSNRDAAIEYLVNKYGKDRVAKLGTVGTFQAKNSTNEVAKQLSLPRFEFDNLINSLPDYAAGDSRGDKALDVALKETDLGKRLIAKYPGFALAGRLSGSPANGGTHASGVILTDDAISNYVTVNGMTNTTMCDLKEAEALNLLKLDLLGLRTLSILEHALQIAGLPKNFLDTLDLNDQATFDVLNDGKFTGLFQYDGAALRYLTAKIKVDCFDDIAIISALARPGALSSGAADAWAARKMGKEMVSYPHPLIEPYLSETLGAMAYQETIMLVAHDVAGLDWAIVSKLRKAIGKSMGPEAMREYGDPFKNGLMAKGISQEVADKFWSDILGAGSYMFNKSHSIAYGMVSYWTCYMKAHYPLEFIAASLSATDTLEKQIAFLREAAKEGVGYLPFDSELSTDKWRVANKDDKKVLVGPLSSVKGLGPKGVQQILSCRARNEPLPDALAKKLSNAKTNLDSLSPIRDALLKTNWKAAVNGQVTRLDKALPNDSWQDYTVLGLVTDVNEVSENDERKVQDRLARGQVGILPDNPMSIGVRLKSDEAEGFFCKVTTKSLDQFRDIVLGLEPDKSLVAIFGSMVPGVPCLIIKSITEIGKI